MEVKFITEEDFHHLIEKLEGIEETAREKIKPHEKFFTNEDICKLISHLKKDFTNLARSLSHFIPQGEWNNILFLGGY
jgi:hypothetical protein